MPDYTLTPLPCWEADCPERFAVYTELSNHHLDVHEALLHGQPVAVWLARDVAQEGHGFYLAPRCRQCGGAIPPHSYDHLRLQLCAICICLGLLAHCAVCGENHPEHGPDGRGCATYVRAPDAPFPDLDAAAPAPSALCTCGHAWIGHSQGAHRQPCAIVDCACAQYELAPPVFPDWHTHSNNPANLSALQSFWRSCAVEGIPYRELDARLLLDKLQVPPDAPAEPYQAAIAEAVSRWRARQGGVA